MQANGVRKIDELGRLVIPKRIRKTLQMREGEPIEIFVNHLGEIILKKYSPIADISSFIQQYIEAMNELMDKNILVMDRDDIIAATGDLKDKYLNRRLSESIANKVELGVLNIELETKGLELIERDTLECTYVLAPIRVNGDNLGAVIMMATEEDSRINEGDIHAVETATKFLGKYLEN